MPGKKKNPLNKIVIKKLIKNAFEAQNFAYTPYSHFKVGAALLTHAGDIIQGCNIESASYSPSNCAERTAFFKAISEGNHDFIAIAIVGNHESGRNPEDDYCAPCGVCRQVMAEFCDKDFKVILAKDATDYKIFSLDELLPYSFGSKDLNIE